MNRYPFDQLEVFADRLGDGNAVAVVHDADDLSDADMRRIARWTKLAETVFVQRPTGDADYRARIFSSLGELPFAGHPTLGAARAWLDRSGSAATEVVQECGAGLVHVRWDDDTFGFRSPSVWRSDAVDDATRRRVERVLGIEGPLEMRWAVNGPEWIAVQLGSAAAVVALHPDLSADGPGGGLAIGVLGATPDPAVVEVRAFLPGDAVPEDPATGSLAAAFGDWLVPAGRLPNSFTVRQGRCLGHDAVLQVRVGADGAVWVWGDVVPGIAGSISV